MIVRRAALLIGSAKASGTSTSEALARYLVARLADRVVVTKLMHVGRSPAGHDEQALVAAIAESDLFILVTPLYVDSLPYLVTRALETVARARQGVRGAPCAFVALVNCGFPEAAQCATALDIARAFAKRAGLQWAGGLAMGEGGAIDGQRLEELGSLTRRVRKALDETADALASGEAVPDAAVAELARPLMPARLYTLLGDFGWKRRASRNCVASELDARPFELARG